MSALRSYKIEHNTPVGEKWSDYQVKNNSGGYVYQVDNKNRLERFLILGTDGGTYYVNEKDITKQNVDFLVKLISNDPKLVLDTVLDVSSNGRAYRNDAAIFVLALVLVHGSRSDKSIAASITPQIARTATHVFELAQYLENLGGWGRAKRTAIVNWFTSKTRDDLAYQAVKYRQRNGWTLRDLMRLSHPVGVDQSVGKFILGKYAGKFSDYDPSMPGIIHGFTEMQNNSDLDDVLETLNRYPSLPWETVPTQFLKEPAVWKKIFLNNQLNGQALVRNVTRMAKIGAFEDSWFRNAYASKLADETMIARTKVHPLQYLLASVTYDQGQMDRHNGYYWIADRRKSWTTRQTISDALSAGFDASFKTVVPAGKQTMIGLDVSGSMSSPALGIDLSAAEVAAAMAMVTLRTEPNTHIYGFANSLTKFNFTNKDSFATILSKTRNLNFGSTNPSLLMNHAQSRKIDVDTFIIITDNEVNTGNHPSQALRSYRGNMGKDAKLVVVGVTATDFTIADPNDRGMLDVVGFDTNAPKVIADFSAGRF